MDYMPKMIQLLEELRKMNQKLDSIDRRLGAIERSQGSRSKSTSFSGGLKYPDDLKWD